MCVSICQGGLKAKLLNNSIWRNQKGTENTAAAINFNSSPSTLFSIYPCPLRSRLKEKSSGKQAHSLSIIGWPCRFTYYCQPALPIICAWHMNGKGQNRKNRSCCESSALFAQHSIFSFSSPMHYYDDMVERVKKIWGCEAARLLLLQCIIQIKVGLLEAIQW